MQIFYADVQTLAFRSGPFVPETVQGDWVWAGNGNRPMITDVNRGQLTLYDLDAGGRSSVQSLNITQILAWLPE